MKMEEVIIDCAGKCGKNIKLKLDEIKKYDYYICGDDKCSNILFSEIEKKSKKDSLFLIKNHTEFSKKAAGDFMGVSFFENIKGEREFGVYGQQKLRVNGKENVFALIPRENRNNSTACNTQNKFSIDDIEGFWGIDGNDLPDPNKECLPDEDEIAGFNIINEDGSMEYISLIDDAPPSLRSNEDILIFCETKLLSYYNKTGKKNGLSQDEIYEKYFAEVGKNNNIRLANVQSGKFDFLEGENNE